MVVQHRVAVLLGDARRAMQLGEKLEKMGASAVLAGSSDELYQALNRHPVDLIVVEQRLGGFLTGVEILERLFHDLLRPATVLVGELTPEEKRRVEAIGVQRVLSADTSLDELAAVALAAARRAERAEDVISPAARHIVQRADYIQPLPQLLVKLVGYLREDELETAALVQDLATDPLLAADLLRYANSSAVGRRQQTTKISDAVTYLGPRKAIGVAVSTGMLRARGALLGDLPPMVHHWHSSRAVLTACTASVFAARLERIAEESAYLLGLVQDLGILVMARAFGDRYVEALHRVQRIAHLNLAHVEEDCFGVTHAEVSAALLRKWEMPSSIISLVLQHHARTDAERAATDQRFLRVMRIGEAFSDVHDNRGSQRYMVLRRHLEHYGSEAAAECRDCLAAAVKKAVELSAIFSVPAPPPNLLETMLRDLSQQVEISAEPLQAEDVAPASLPEASPLRDQEQDEMPIILVIDDEPCVARTVGLYLRDWRCRVLACDTQAEAKELTERADLVLCDIHLRNEDGIDLVRELRDDGFEGPIIMVSGDGYRGTVMDSIHAGVNDYLLKPFFKAQLVEKLRKHLGATLRPADNRRREHAEI